MGIIDNVYSATSDFGKINAIISAFIVTIIGIFMIIVGIIFIKNKSILTSNSTGIIKLNSDCVQNTNIWTCNMNVSFKDTKGDLYTINNLQSYDENKYINGGNITIYYDPNNPNNAKLQTDNKHIIGYFLVSIAIFIIIISWLTVWLSQKYKIFAAAEGVNDITHLFEK